MPVRLSNKMKKETKVLGSTTFGPLAVYSATEYSVVWSLDRNVEKERSFNDNTKRVNFRGKPQNTKKLQNKS